MDISLSRGRGRITESINSHALENLFNVFGNDVRNEKKILLYLFYAIILLLILCHIHILSYIFHPISGYSDK